MYTDFAVASGSHASAAASASTCEELLIVKFLLPLLLLVLQLLLPLMVKALTQNKTVVVA